MCAASDPRAWKAVSRCDLGTATGLMCCSKQVRVGVGAASSSGVLDALQLGADGCLCEGPNHAAAVHV